MLISRFTQQNATHIEYKFLTNILISYTCMHTYMHLYIEPTASIYLYFPVYL